MEVSLVAFKLWVLLTQRPGLYHISEVLRELHCSKSGLLNAAYELEDLGLISLSVED